MITRTEAIEALYRVINSDIIGDGIERALEEIANCIEAESVFSIHAWGMPDNEYCLLCTSVMTDSPDYIKHVQRKQAIIDKYSYVSTAKVANKLP